MILYKTRNPGRTIARIVILTLLNGQRQSGVIPISERTVQRYLQIMNFNVKKVSFSPPDRNSVGLRIFRYAWVHFIESSISQRNILLGFIDEAGVTTSGVLYQ